MPAARIQWSDPGPARHVFPELRLGGQVVEVATRTGLEATIPERCDVPG